MEKIKRLRDIGYIEKVHPDNYRILGRVWFLPHFATKQEKFLVVCDGSAEFEQQSINAEIFPVPDLLVPLFITRFQVEKYVITADLKECSFQIGIPPEQRNFFCILWYVEDDINHELEIWRFTVQV